MTKQLSVILLCGLLVLSWTAGWLCPTAACAWCNPASSPVVRGQISLAECCPVEPQGPASCPLCGPECPCALQDDQPSRQEPRPAPAGSGLHDLWRLLADANRLGSESPFISAPATWIASVAPNGLGAAARMTVDRRLAITNVRTT